MTRHALPKLTLCVLAIFIVASCSSLSSKKPRQTRFKGATPQDLPLSKSGNPENYVVFGKTYYLLSTTKGYKEKGMASWYGDKFHGKPTSSGAAYDMHAYTAAHKTLPIPSFVTVTNTETNKSITVMVNDRGPFVKGRIIDLSFAAAKELDVVQNGTAPVIVEAVGPYQYLNPDKKPRSNPTTKAVSIPQAAPTPIPAPAYAANNVTHNPANNAASLPNNPVFAQQYFDQSPTRQEFSNASSATPTPVMNNAVDNNSGYRIQLGSFGSEQNAHNFQQNMANRLQQPTQVKYDNGLYRVYTGHYNSREEAGNAAFSLPVSTTIVHF